MNNRKILAFMLSVTLATTTLAAAVSSKIVRAASEQVTRTSGSDRYQTAAQVATSNWTTSDNVVLVSGEGYADAISASVLAKKLNAPILLTTSKNLNAYAKTALDKLKPKKIYIIGGNASVSKEVRDSLKGLYDLVELQGANRYETNAAVAKKLVELGVDPSNVILVGGEGFSDALSVAPIAAARGEILLLGNNDLDYIKPVTSFINDHKSKVTVVGTNFVINDDAYKAINGVSRISGGTDRFDTNLKVLAAFKDDVKTSKVYVANSSGDGYADALVASVLAGKNAAPLVLVDSETSKATANAISYLKSNLTAESDIQVLGGVGVIPESIVAKINESGSTTNNQTNPTANNQTNAAGNSNTEQTFTGYIIDEDCFAAMSDDPGSDTKNCLNMASCAGSGYGIAVSQGGIYKFYYFDGNFAPNATASQVQAANLIKNTTKKDHVTVTVKGTLKGDTKTAADGKSYEVITVSNLSESNSSSGAPSGSSSSSASSNNADLNDGGTHSGNYTILTNTGTFGSTDSSHSTTINGNVDVSYHSAAATDSITLQNLNINGTLAVDFGEGNVTLDNVTVNGVKVTKVGANSFHAKGDTSIKSLIINDNAAHIVIEENAIITDTTVNAGVKLEVASNATNAKPFENVTIASAAAANNIVLAGGFNNLIVSNPEANIDLQASTIETLVVSSQAAGAKVKTADTTNITNLNVNAPISVTGNGSITNANIGVNGTVIEKAPTSVSILAGVKATVAGQTKDESNTKKIESIPTTPAILSSISITGPAKKLNYIIGDKLDIKGLQITGTYSDNTTAVVPINKSNVIGFDSSKEVNGQVLTITVGGKTATYTITVNAAPTVQTFTGYIIDQDCFNSKSNPGNDTKPCLQMKGCAASGYGIGVPQNDGTYKFYYFDGAFAPNATGTQVKAYDLIDKSTKNTHISIAVTGTLNGETKTIDGVSYPVITVTSLTEAPEPTPVSVVTPQVYEGWLSDSTNAVNVSDPTKIAKTSLGNSDYGIVIVQPDYSFKFYKFDEDGQKLAKETILDKTAKDKDLRIKVNGILDGDILKISTIQEEQELIGIILTKSTFEKSSDPATVKRDDIVAADSAASGYGIAVKQNDGTYKFYKFDEDGNKSAKSLLSWYVKWADNISSIPVLVQGVVDGDNIVTSKVIRERYISGQLASKAIFDKDKALKDITRADLLTPESVASGYGYYVHSCGGHQYFPFDKDSNELIKNFIENSPTQGKIKVIPKGFWYWIGNTIKVTSITEDTKAETTPETPVNEEISGVVANRSYFKGSEYQQLGAPGTITKDSLLAPENAASGYGIIYRTCCKYGYLRFDENGTKLIKDIINKSNNTSNIGIIVQGTRDEDTIYVTNIIEAYDQTYSGTLIKTDADGYGIKVKQEDGTYKFYKFDTKGSYYRKSGQVQGESFLTSLKKDTTTVDVKGAFDGDSIVVSSIKENLSITPAPSESTGANEQTLTGYIQDVHCFLAKSDPSADTKGCLLMKSCAASGFGITVTQSDGSKKFYFFDGTFANNGSTFTPGTDGQLQAWNLVQSTTKLNNISISVKGTLNGTEKTYVDKNGVSHSFPVLTLSSLAETSTLNNIDITKPATKLTYSVGDPLDITGLVVTGTYDDNTKAAQSITAANVTGFDSLAPVNGQILTITVGGKTTTYTINVNPVPTSIAITKPANKLTYTVKDKLDITGLEVTAAYSDGTAAIIPITAANVTGFDSSKPADGQTVTITVGGKTTTYTINVVAAAPVVQTFTGFIQDEDCFIGYAPNYGEDTKMCLSMKSCAKSGYGITALQSDGSYKYYYFDGNFATFSDGKTFDGTGSQLTAWNLIQNTTKQNNISIKVTGTLNGDKKAAADGKTYEVITVSSLVEN